jgi:hypothetical protein
MKRVLMFAVGLMILGIAAVAWERSRWLREMREQCDAAQPLLSVSANRDDVIRKLGSPSVEYTHRDWSTIERNFGNRDGSTDKIRDIREKLRDDGRMMVYSRSNSIMFMYFDNNGQVGSVSCFLQ